jgi:hypothetical protein
MLSARALGRRLEDRGFGATRTGLTPGRGGLQLQPESSYAPSFIRAELLTSPVEPAAAVAFPDG